MGDLTKPQREAVLAVLAAALSPQGYEKILQIVEADELLRKSSGETIFGAMNIMSRSSANLPPPSRGWFSSAATISASTFTLVGEQRTLAP
jgi:hypothetical protein